MWTFVLFEVVNAQTEELLLGYVQETFSKEQREQVADAGKFSEFMDLNSTINRAMSSEKLEALQDSFLYRFEVTKSLGRNLQSILDSFVYLSCNQPMS